jgi:hypothetical protein
LVVTAGQSACGGKGGSHGDVFMMEHAIKMLKQQGHSGYVSRWCCVETLLSEGLN